MQSINYFLFVVFKKSLNLSLFCKVNQIKTNLNKYLHPSSLNQHIYAHMQCREPKMVPILKKTTGLCPSRSYYSWNGGRGGGEGGMNIEQYPIR